MHVPLGPKGQMLLSSLECTPIKNTHVYYI